MAPFRRPIPFAGTPQPNYKRLEKAYSIDCSYLLELEALSFSRSPASRQEAGMGETLVKDVRLDLQRQTK